MSIRKIAETLGRAPSTISRELRRNTVGQRGYRPFDAHRKATARRARHHRRRIESNAELRELIGELLRQRWSPQQISRELEIADDGFQTIRRCGFVTRASTRRSTRRSTSRDRC
ncbi:helix-turn-helix domain-containing protein [Nocardioides sp.]|uniref:helix-turn-helix domain-containing protein n=1 Tax=Nocardioides sp. TaxID=35761 RepID=UPI003D65C1AC